jgi:hypothetical protein
MMTTTVHELVGRETETRRLNDLPRTSRLVVVTGLAGVGKSALAGRLVRDLTGQRPHVRDLSEPSAAATAFGAVPATGGLLLSRAASAGPRSTWTSAPRPPSPP